MVGRALFDDRPNVTASEEEKASWKRHHQSVKLSYTDCSRDDKMDTQGAERICAVDVEELLKGLDERDGAEYTFGTRLLSCVALHALFSFCFF